jgi:hypothetical protein
LDGVIPEPRGVRIPQHRPLVVKALWAKRPAQFGAVIDVTDATGLIATMSARLFCIGILRSTDTISKWRDGMYRAERGRRQGNEKTRMTAHLFGRPLAAKETCGHQDPRIGLVGVRTRRTDDGPSILA